MLLIEFYPILTPEWLIVIATKLNTCINIFQRLQEISVVDPKKMNTK